MTRRVLVLADLHVAGFTKLATIDGRGIPDRLSQFDYLGEDLAALIKSRGVVASVFAGDTLQSASGNRPMVLNTAQRFLESITRDVPGLIISGNHDIDADSMSEETGDHSALLSLVRHIPKLVYMPGSGYTIVGGVGMQARSFLSGPDNYIDIENNNFADMFIGHGYVSGSVDPFGYVYKNGFSAEELCKQYAVSVIGDIHNYQIFRETSGQNVVIVPGQSIQQNHSSGFPPGAVIVDVDTREVEFIHTRSLPNAARYHYFRTAVLDKKELKEFPNTHYKEPVVVKKGKKKHNKKVDSNVTLLDRISAELESSNIGNRDVILAKMTELYEAESATSTAAAINEMKFVSCEIENFLSIGAPVVIEFDKPDSLVLIYGSGNGVGKTAMFEAVYWALTGGLTKSVGVSDISYDRGNSPASVKLKFSSPNGDLYTIVRTRNTDQLLKFYKGDKDITKDSVKNTQELIYNVLGFAADDILLLTYFSLNELNLFSSLTVNFQLKFISRLTDTGRLGGMREQLKKFMREISDKLIEDRSMRRTLEERVAIIQEKVSTLEFDAAAARQAKPEEDGVMLGLELASQRKTVQSLEVITAALMEESIELSARKEEIAQVKEHINLLGSKLSANKFTMAQLLKSISVKESELASAKDGKCFVCGGVVHNKDLEKTVEVDLAQLKSELIMLSQRTKLLASEIPTLDESILIALENDSDTLNLRRKENSVALIAARAVVISLEKRLSNVSAPNNIEIQIQTLKEELTELTAKLGENDIPRREAVQTDFIQAAKLLEETSKNRVYTGMVDDAYDKFVESMNNLLTPTGFEVSVGTGYAMRVKVDSGKPRPIAALSGGEKRVLDFVALMALNEVFQSAFGLNGPLLGIQCFDEVFTYLHEDNLHYAHGLLQDVKGIKLVISNDAGVIGLFDDKIYVTKDKDGSKYAWK